MTTNPPKKHRRPLAITIVVWVLVLSAISSIIIGAFSIYLDNALSHNFKDVVIFAQDDPDLLTDDGALLADGVYNVIAGLVQLVIIVGFLREKRSAWVAAMSWQALKLLVELATPFSDQDKVPTMVFCIVLIFLLNQSDVRRVFSIQRPENAPSTVKPLNVLDVN